MPRGEKIYRYTPVEGLKQSPGVIRIAEIGKIAVGAPIEVTPTPPGIPFTIPEATQEQYALLWRMGYKYKKRPGIVREEVVEKKQKKRW
jgi:hypothetical protein